MNKKLIIVSAAGAVGYMLSERLLASGTQVVQVDDLPDKSVAEVNVLAQELREQLLPEAVSVAVGLPSLPSRVTYERVAPTRTAADVWRMEQAEQKRLRKQQRRLNQ